MADEQELAFEHLDRALANVNRAIELIRDGGKRDQAPGRVVFAELDGAARHTWEALDLGGLSDGDAEAADYAFYRLDEWSQAIEDDDEETVDWHDVAQARDALREILAPWGPAPYRLPRELWVTDETGLSFGPAD
jgi:hypothetical protein